jgi:outer membrane protein assembly factor BamB
MWPSPPEEVSLKVRRGFTARSGRTCTVAAGILAVLGALGVPAAAAPQSAAAPVPLNSWPQYSHDAVHTGTNPNEHAFNTGDIANLKVVSKAHVGDNSLDKGGPVVANGRLYIGDVNGAFSVFSTDGCGTDSCEPLWQAHIDGTIDSTPALAGNLVLFASTNTRLLYAFAADGCGATECQPVWTGKMKDGATGSVTVAEGIAYVGDFTGHLYAFKAAGCGLASCSPLWVGVGRTDELLDTPAVANGNVYVTSFEHPVDLVTGRLLVFPAAGCGLSTCKPTWTADIGGPGTGVTVAGNTVFTGSSTLFGDGTNTDFHLMAFPAGGCGGLVCKPLRTYFTGDIGTDGAPAVAGGVVLASTNGSPDPGFIGGVSAYPVAGCGKPQCQPAWTGVSFALAPSSPPVVVDDVVLVGKGPASGFPVDAGFFTYNLHGCEATICEPISLLQLGETQGYNGAPLAVAEHKIFMASTDNSDGHSNVYTAALP